MRAKPGMLMTTAILKKRQVCRGWRLKFRRRFPTARIRITQALCEKYAQTWPWGQMAEKLLTPDGNELFKEHRRNLELARYTPNPWTSDHVFSTRARNMALASMFGYLAQQKMFDPATYE